MISCEDKKRLQELICQEFPEYSEEKREQMVEALVKKEGAYVAFCECIGKHVSKIGVKFRKDNGDKGKMYYSTAYNNEKFDL